jgi:ankyrin repeat protein
VFTQQWLDEDGATAFLRAAQSSDVPVMRLLLAHGADPKIGTEFNVTALQVAAGVAWVDGITYEWSEQANVEAVKLLLDLGLDPNFQNDMGLTALHGAAHKGRNAVVQLLVDHGGRLDIRDYGLSFFSPDTPFRNHQWLPVDWADGFIRIGTQSPVPHPETGLLIRKLMKDAGLPVPRMDRTIYDLCQAEVKCEQPDLSTPR